MLFSAAYRPDVRLQRVWDLPHAPALVSSPYAEAEARRNLDASAHGRLDALLACITLVPDVLDGALPGDVTLPEQDRPILRTARATAATHLLTGGWKHFGPYVGDTAGLRIAPPGAYLVHDQARA